MIYSCYKCPGHKAGCHDTCERYKAEVEAHNREKEARYKDHLAEFSPTARKINIQKLRAKKRGFNL